MIWEEWVAGAPTFLPITVPANQLISKVAERMLARLSQEDWPVWLGEADAPLREIEALLGACNDRGTWEMKEQTSPAKLKSDGPKQMDMF